MEHNKNILPVSHEQKRPSVEWSWTAEDEAEIQRIREKSKPVISQIVEGKGGVRQKFGDVLTQA